MRFREFSGGLGDILRRFGESEKFTYWGQRAYSEYTYPRISGEHA